MGTEMFIEQCKKVIVEYFNHKADKTDKKQITEEDVFVALTFS